MKKLILGIVCLCFIPFLNSQTLIRETLGSFGSTYSENGTLIRQTAGQPSNTSVEITNDKFILRQGFQQPILLLLSLGKNIRKCNFNVYPNPVVDFVTIENKENVEFRLMKIFDTQGKEIYGEYISNTSSFSKNLDFLSNGNYFIFLIDKNNAQCQEQIIKFK